MTVWINIILLLIKYGPDIIALIKEIMEQLSDGSNDEVVKTAGEVRDAVRRHKFSRNKKQLRNEIRSILERLNQRNGSL